MKAKRLQRTLERLRDHAADGPSEADYRDVYEALGREVGSARARLALSQRELAELCGTTQSSIARLETGRRAARLDTLLRVAHALDCELVVQLRPRATRKGEGRR
ncbi:MAG: helix-turn-helix transcriptional regulator [Actinobacteria bacterium]|nr:helix-turn-helix transcriptional regulator [Actinomycetota bacterium]